MRLPLVTQMFVQDQKGVSFFPSPGKARPQVIRSRPLYCFPTSAP